VLVERSKMEQRYDAVLGVLRDGFSVTEVARKFNVSRQSVHAWLARVRAVVQGGEPSTCTSTRASSRSGTDPNWSKP
jgi:transposase-like protein